MLIHWDKGILRLTYNVYIKLQAHWFRHSRYLNAFSHSFSPLTGSLLLWVHSLGKGGQLPVERCSPSSWRVRHQVNQRNLISLWLASCSPSVSAVLFVSALSSPIPPCCVLQGCGTRIPFLSATSDAHTVRRGREYLSLRSQEKGSEVSILPETHAELGLRMHFVFFFKETIW